MDLGRKSRRDDNEAKEEEKISGSIYSLSARSTRPGVFQFLKGRLFSLIETRVQRQNIPGDT